MSKKHPSSPLRISFITLGCAKNLIDTEKMLAFLVQEDMVLVGSDDSADAIIINTCGFIAEARDEALEHIACALERKRNGQIGYVVVVGCLAQYQPEKLTSQFPQIDAIVGLANRQQIASKPSASATANSAAIICSSFWISGSLAIDANCISISRFFAILLRIF